MTVTVNVAQWTATVRTADPWGNTTAATTDLRITFNTPLTASNCNWPADPVLAAAMHAFDEAAKRAEQIARWTREALKAARRALMLERPLPPPAQHAQAFRRTSRACGSSWRTTLR